MFPLCECLSQNVATPLIYLLTLECTTKFFTFLANNFFKGCHPEEGCICMVGALAVSIVKGALSHFRILLSILLIILNNLQVIQVLAAK